MAILEVLTFDASDAYKGDQEATWKALGEILSGTEGLLSFNHGLNLENTDKGFIIATWVSVDAFKALVTGTEPRSERFIGLMKLGMRSKPDIRFFELGDQDTRPLVSAPITEIAVCTLKNGKTPEEFYQWADDLRNAVVPASGRKELHGMSSPFPKVGSRSVSEDHAFVLLLGWDSVEASI